MKLLRLIACVLVMAVSLNAIAQEETVDKKAKREARKQERIQKKQEKKAKAKDSVYEELVPQEAQQEDAPLAETPVVVETPKVESQTVTETPVVEIKSIEPKEVKSEKPAVKPQAPAPAKVKTDTSSKESSEASSSDDESTGVFIIVALILVFVIWVLRKLFWTRCPNCKKFFAMRVVNEEYYGRSKSKREKDSNGQYYTQYYHNYKVTRACKHCGAQRYHIEERKA